MAQPRRRVRVPLRQRWSDLVRGPLPALVWLVAGFGAYKLIELHHAVHVLPGVAHGLQANVTSTRAGSLREVAVGWFDDVNPGEIVGVLDDAVLLARINTARSSITQFEADLRAEEERVRNELAQIQAESATDRFQELRRFQSDETSYSLRGLEVRVDLESDRLLEQRLSAQLARAVRLAETEVGVKSDVEDLGLERDQVHRRIGESEKLLASTDQELAVARARREAYEQRAPLPLPESSDRLAALRAAIEVQKSLLAEVSIEKNELLLRAPIAGRLQSLLAQPGENVLAGQVIATVAADRADRVIAYLSEYRDPSFVRTEREVSVARSMARGARAIGKVMSLGPAVEQIPQRLWVRPNQPEYGRAIWISFEPSFSLITGERVEVSFDD